MPGIWRVSQACAGSKDECQNAENLLVHFCYVFETSKPLSQKLGTRIHVAYTDVPKACTECIQCVFNAPL